MAISNEEEDISPECARKRFLTGLSEGLPECRDASLLSLFMVLFIVLTLVELI